MKIKILGTRGEIEESAGWHTKHSGILIDDHFLIDLGEEEYLDYDPSFVIFTHFHPDHAFFVRKENTLSGKIHAFGPEQNEKIPDLILIQQDFEVDSFRFTPIPVIHSLKVKSLAYIIEKGGKRFLYTGDVAWIEKRYQDSFGNLDMVITEGSFIKKGGMIRRDKKSGNIFGHTGIPDLIRIFAKHTQHIVFMHFGSWFMRDIETGREKIAGLAPEGIKLEAASDGQEFRI